MAAPWWSQRQCAPAARAAAPPREDARATARRMRRCSTHAPLLEHAPLLNARFSLVRPRETKKSEQCVFLAPAGDPPLERR
jgi:hypothetical protein